MKWTRTSNSRPTVFRPLFSVVTTLTVLAACNGDRRYSPTEPPPPATPTPAQEPCPPGPPLPPSTEVATPGAYPRVTPQCQYALDWAGGRLDERLLLEPDGRFQLELDSPRGRFADPGTYVRNGSAYTLQFDRWSRAGPLTAQAVFRGRCVVVDYHFLLEFDYSDAEYCR